MTGGGAGPFTTVVTGLLTVTIGGSPELSVMLETLVIMLISIYLIR